MQVVPVTKALVLDDAGNMLILRRSDTHPTLALEPDLPGGIVDEGEDFGQALVREMFEETGLVITLADIEPVFAGADMGHGVNRVRMLYLVRLKSTKPKVTISWEHDQAEWLPVEKMAEVETKYHSFYGNALHYVREHKLV